MKQPQNQASSASETTRFFCTRISSAASAAGELCTTRRKEPDMANRNTNPGGGKTAVPADINNAQPAYFPKPHHTWEGQRPRCPQPHPETAQTPKSNYPQKQHNTAIKFPLFLGSRPRCFSRNHGEAGGVQPRRSGRYRTPQTSAVGIPFGLKRQRRLISASRGRRSLARRNSSAKPTA